MGQPAEFLSKKHRAKLAKFERSTGLGRLRLFELERGDLFLVAELTEVKQKEIDKYRRPEQLAVWDIPALPGVAPVVICSDFALLDAYRQPLP